VKDQRHIWNSLIDGAAGRHRLRSVMSAVSQLLSEVTGRVINNDEPIIERIPIGQVHMRAGGPEERMVGIYLVIGGGLHGQAIIILPMSSALALADLMMDEPQGRATELGLMEQSALSELGNMTLAAFLNSVASLDDVPDLLRPSPPAVMVDMLGAILNVIVTPVAAVRDDLLIIETAFQDTAPTIQGRFWVLPDPALETLVV